MRIRNLLLAIVALAVLPCSAVRAQQTEIVIYHYQTDKRHEALKEVFRRFEAENAGIKIVEIFKPDQTITADIQAALAARRPVDIATIAGRNVYFMSRNTAAVPVNQDAGKAGFLDNYLPQFLDVGRHGDKVFAMPYAFGTPMLYYNKDIFRKAGLDPDAPPKTWDEVISAAKAIQDKTGVAGVAHLTAGNKDYGTMLMVTNAGATYLNAEGDKLMFDSPEGIAGLQLWQDLVIKHKVMPIATDAQWTAAFFGGRLAMYITSSAGLRQMVQQSQGKFELGVANYPLFPGRSVRKVPNSGATFMLYAPAGPRREASLKFLRSSRGSRWPTTGRANPATCRCSRIPCVIRTCGNMSMNSRMCGRCLRKCRIRSRPMSGRRRARSKRRASSPKLIDDLWAGKGTAAELVPIAVRQANTALAKTN